MKYWEVFMILSIAAISNWIPVNANYTNYTALLNGTIQCTTNVKQRSFYVTIGNGNIKKNADNLSQSIRDKLNLNHSVYIITETDKYVIFMEVEIVNNGTCMPSKQPYAYKSELYDICGSTNETENTYADYNFTHKSVNFVCTPYNIKDLKPLFCYGGGYYDPSLKKCICNTKNVETGPNCEISEISLSKISRDFYEYPNVMKKTNELVLRFDFFSSAIKFTNHIFSLYNPKTKDSIDFNLAEQEFIIEHKNNSLKLSFIFDSKNNWWKFILHITTKKIQLFVNNKTGSLTDVPLNNFLNHSNFTTLKIRNIKHKLCIRNLYINDRLINLNRDQTELCCYDRCESCNGTHKVCNCIPFKTQGNSKCQCKLGYIMNENKKECVPYKNSTVELKANEKKIIPIKNTKIDSMKLLEFMIRTRIQNGTLVNFILDKENIIIKVNNGHLGINDKDIHLYKFSDGNWHIVTILLTPRYIQLSLDENMVHNYVYKIGPSFYSLSKVEMGPMDEDNYPNKTACLQHVKFDGVEMKVNFTKVDNCTDFKHCSPVCTGHKICKNISWQHNECRCKDGYINVTNDKCVAFVCDQKKCLNGGTCEVLDINMKKYKCDCPRNYIGSNCETLYKDAAVFWWWIVLLVLILLLILLIIIIWCICRKKSDQDKYPNINEINEDTVRYNVKAGEEDYKGPPINFEIITNALKNSNAPNNATTINVPSTLELSKLDQLKRHHDLDNNDLVIDHPLEYGYEGDDDDEKKSDLGSLGSGSTNAELDTSPIQQIGNSPHTPNSRIQDVYKI